MRFVGERRCGERGEEDEKAGQGEIIGDLYLRQIALVYVNTPMILSVLREAAWRRRMGQEDLRALTPLLHGHVNSCRPLFAALLVGGGRVPVGGGGDTPAAVRGASGADRPVAAGGSLGVMFAVTDEAA
jgi:hypothetical protein